MSVKRTATAIRHRAGNALLNVHFKAPTDDYVKTFEQMEQDGVISTRGLETGMPSNTAS